MIRLLLAFLLILPAMQAPPDVVVESRDGRLTIVARGVSLKDALDAISRETGVKVIYRGPDPPPVVTVTLEDLSEREALVRMLEGLALNLALKTDASGRHVDMLIVEDSYGSGPATPSARAPSVQGVRSRMVRPSSVSEVFPGDVSEAGGFDDTGVGAAGDPADPAWEDGSGEDWLEERPRFPAEASIPLPPGLVPYPVFPGYASH